MPNRAIGAAGIVALMGAIAVSVLSSSPAAPAAVTPLGTAEALPSPRVTGTVSLEAALQARRSVRSFTDETLDTWEVGQLLWAAQGVTDAEGRRTAPSAGALYPLELDAVTAAGVARYVPDGHRLRWRGFDDLRAALQGAAIGQEAVGSAPLVIVVSGVVSRTAARYGDRAERYVALEAGHAAQNVLLEAVSLGLGAVPIGAFDDGTVRRILGLPGTESPVYLIAVGHPA